MIHTTTTTTITTTTTASSIHQAARGRSDSDVLFDINVPGLRVHAEVVPYGQAACELCDFRPHASDPFLSRPPSHPNVLVGFVPYLVGRLRYLMCWI